MKTMWIMFERAQVPDAAPWPGRRWLAAVDAVAWPVAAGMLLAQIPGRAGVFVPTAFALLALFGARRLHRAVWTNHRYRFTTVQVGGVLLTLLLVGVVLKLAMA